MKKTKSHAFGKDVYLLGADSSGVYYWLEAASFACNWYWGGGYVESYTNNKCPNHSRDIKSHQHFDSLVLRGKACCFDNFKALFVETPLSDREVWKLCELMQSFYTARKYSDMLYSKGAHITSNPIGDTISNSTEYKRINESVIPAIMREVYNILEGSRND